MTKNPEVLPPGPGPVWPCGALLAAPCGREARGGHDACSRCLNRPRPSSALGPLTATPPLPTRNGRTGQGPAGPGPAAPPHPRALSHLRSPSPGIGRGGARPRPLRFGLRPPAGPSAPRGREFASRLRHSSAGPPGAGAGSAAFTSPARGLCPPRPPQPPTSTAN